MCCSHHCWESLKKTRVHPVPQIKAPQGKLCFKRSCSLSHWHQYFICIYWNTLKNTGFYTPASTPILFSKSTALTTTQTLSLRLADYGEPTKPPTYPILSVFLECVLLSYFRMNANPGHKSIWHPRARAMRSLKGFLEEALGQWERGDGSPAELDRARRFFWFSTLLHCLLLFFLKNSSVPVMHFFNAWPTFSGVLGCRDSSACSSSALLHPPPHPPRPPGPAHAGFQLFAILPPHKRNLWMAHLVCKRAAMQSRARTIPVPGLCGAIPLLI